MESYLLLLKVGSRDAEWVLERDGPHLTLTDPEGQVVFATQPAHRVTDLYYLAGENEIRLIPEHDYLVFRKNRAALVAVQAAVEAGLAADAPFRHELEQRSARAIRDGLGMFAVAGTLFGAYCWWAFTGHDPQPGIWLHWVFQWLGLLIGWALLVLLAFALAGPWVAYTGFCQRSWVHRAERTAQQGDAAQER